MTIPPISLGITKGAEWLKARNAEMFSFGQAHGLMNKKAEHTSVHALAGRLQAGPNGNLELTVPSSLIKGVFDALDEPGAEFVVRNNRTECAIKVMTKEEVDKLGGTSHITERGHSYHYTLGPIVELPASGDYDKLWAISIKSNDLEDIRKSYGLATSPQLGFYIPVGCKKSKVTEDNKVSKLAGALNPWHKQVQHFIGQGYTPIAAPDGNVTFKKGDKYYSWAHDTMDGQLKEVSPADAAADLEYSGPWNEPELYHGSPKVDLQSLSKGSYVTPDLETAKLMGRFHEGTGKTWTDDDLEEPHYFGKQPKWKAGREPKGEPAIYRLIAATKKLNLLDNPYEHTTLEELPVSKLASAAEDPMYLHSYIPSGSIKHVKEHGLLSGNELAKPENRHLLDIARPNGDADRWLKEREEKLIKSPWANTYNGPSVLFGDLDPDKIHDKHPIKKFNTTRARINLHALLKDYPTTKLEGSELIPFSDEVYDALDEKGQNEFVNKRHHTLSPEEIKSLIARGQNPKDMWKDFKDTEGKYYASDVPHAKVVTPMGKIPSKYIEFDEEAPVSKLAGLLKQSVYWSKDVSRDLLNGRKYPLSYLTGELGELGESIKKMDWPNFKEELGDSAYAAQMILAQKLGLNLPLIGASAPIDKFYARRKGWEEVFKERGIPFSNDYLAGGSNLKKPKKIQAALGLAGHAISKEDARTASLKYGGGIEDDWVDDIGGVSKLARLLKWAEGPASIGTPGGKPAAAPKGPSLNSTPPSNLGGGLNGNTGTMNLSGGRPQFNQGAQNDLLNSYTNFQKNNPSTANVQYPAPVQGGSTRYHNNEQVTQYARQADVLNNKTTRQQVEQMNPGEKMIYDRRSRPSNEQLAADQLAGKVDPNANSPFKPSGPPLSAKNQEVANAKHYTEQAYTDRQNLRPGSVAFNRSEQQRVADETAGAIPQFVASTALAGPIGKVLGTGAKAIGGYVIPKIAPAFARWAAPAAHEAAHVAGHLGAESLLPAAYTATPTGIKSAPAWLGAKVVHEVGHQASNVSSAVGNAWNKAKGAMGSVIGPKSIPQGGADITNTPHAGSDTNRSPTIQPEA